MENKNIIIILLVIIVILAAVIGFLLFNPHAKEPTKIKITSDKEQYEGGELSIKLTDLNKTPISKEIVNVTITNKKGKVVVDEVVKTNSKGNAKLDLDLKKGKYNVNVTYGGNENYTGNNTTQKLTIKEEVKETVSESYYASSDYYQSSKPPRTEYTGDPNDREAYTEWRKQDLQSANPHRGYSVLLDGPENSPVK
ncbi:hypothetical protein [Methanobrevibacter sp.]|uniref:hypothetical protein n=1 Tax=Methanobrevibacter sp. TaxID=66852 RepID=UPI003865C8D7